MLVNVSVPRTTLSISRWKVAGARRSPNDIVVNSNRPFGVMNAVFGWSSGATGTFQYPLLSKV